jgi:hypothetical protein
MPASPVPIDGPASPFSMALADDAASLPPAFREQFLLAPEHQHAVLFEGRMDRVWRRPAWLWPVFWLLTRSNILFPETGTDVPATMIITAGRDENRRPYQRWSRTFAFTPPRHFDATMGYDQERGQVVEWFGGAGRLEVAWDVGFRPPDTIEIATRGATARFGRCRLPIPRPLCIAVQVIEQADRDRDDAITIDLRLSVPLLGAVFGYSGDFRLRRIDRSRAERGDSGAVPDA